MMHISKTRASTELVFAGVIWGFGFIATVWALESFPPYWLTAIRFLLSFLISLPWIWYKSSNSKISAFEEARTALIPGVLIGLTLIFQTIGLQFTNATKSSFITVMYLLFVPVLEQLFQKTKSLMFIG